MFHRADSPLKYQIVVIAVLAKRFDYESLSKLVVDVDKGSFTRQHLDNFKTISDANQKVELETSSSDHYQTILKDCGQYLFRPYYRDDYKGIGKLLPIQLWAENERDSAYAQIAQVVREAIAKL